MDNEFSRDSGRSSILEAWTPPSHGSLTSLEAVIERSYDEMVNSRVSPNVSVAESAARVAAIDLDHPVGLEAALTEAADLMRDGDLLSGSSRCFGYFNPTAAWPAVVADVLSATRNPQICVVSHAPASVALERRVVDYMREALGFPDSSTGNFTSGGSEANASALLVALVRANEDFAKEGARSFAGTPRIYASCDSHLAWVKIVRAQGLGVDALRLIPTSSDGRLDAAALEAQIRKDREAGDIPVFIAATAGTTNAGAIDPLHACRKIADRYDIHLHVDAAWAGALIVDASKRPLLSGIEDADTVTIDAHKWLSVPMGAGMFFARDRGAVAKAYSVQTGYMPDGDGVDAYVTTNQWSRRLLGLRLWMMLRATGPEGYAAMFEKHFDAADYLRKRLRENGWTVRGQDQLPVVLFDDVHERLGSRELAAEIERDGSVWLGCVQYEGRTMLRACMTSFHSGRAEIDQLITALTNARSKLGQA